LLVGCGERANPSAPASPANETQVAPSVNPQPEMPSSSNETQAVPSDNPVSETPLSVTEEEEPEPVYIDESQYEGDELIFVQLINRSVRYINEENEDGYKSLLASNSPINSMPQGKVNKVELVEIGDPYGSNVAVNVNYWKDGVEQSRTYVFTKENNEWKILDID
jgi:hypothetical protein